MLNKNACSRLCLFLSLLFFALQVNAQVRKITGKVTSADGANPLTGVSVLIKGKAAVTQTLSNGSFALSVSDNDVLVLTYVGYQSQEIPVKGKETINVVLKPETQALNDVVVVGYGTQTRKSITSSIGKIDTNVLSTAPRSNVGTALQGSVAGVQVVNSTGTPGSTPMILLRGGASINSPQAPLVVVDGVVRGLNDIPSEDIASIELLRDAASTAIYGARANNGVILITTKQGQAGKAQLSYKFTEGYNKQRDGYQYMGAKDYIYYNRLGNLNSGRTLAQVNASRGFGLLTDAANLASFDIRSFTGGTPPPGWDTVTDPYGGTIMFKDHNGEISNLLFRNTQTQDHYVSLTAGTEKSKLFSSFDYYNEDGIIVGSTYKRYSGNINASFKLNPRLELTTGANFSTSNQLGLPNSEANTIYRSRALWPTFNPWLDSAKTMPNPGNGTTDGNPLYLLQKIQRINEVNQITANASLKYEILPGLYAKVSGVGYYYENLQQSFQDATQTYAQMFSTPPAYTTTRPSSMYYYRYFQQQYNAILNYTHTFFGKHHLNAMVGSEFFGQKFLTMQVYGTNAPTDFISTANASTTFAAGNNYSTKSQYAIVSGFGRIAYDYDQRYLLNLVAREDGVSNLAEKNRWGFFPGMSGGWNMHNENFYKNSAISKYITTLKPRISYGVNGNASLSSISAYGVQGTFGAQTNYDGVGGYLNTGIVNSGLQWEQSKTLDYGADIGILKNKVIIAADIYDRRTSNLLTSLPLPSFVGFGSVTTNLGTLQNHGYELTVTANIVKLPNSFTWDVSANISHNLNKVLKLPYNGNQNNRQGGLQVWDPKSGTLQWVGGIQEGHALGDIYAFKQVSIFKDAAEVQSVAGNRVDMIGSITGPNLAAGKGGHITPGDVNWLDVDKNDTIDSRDQVYIGNIYPKYTGGFSTSFSFKNFSMYWRFDYAFGHTIYNDLVPRTLGNYQGTFNYIELQKRAWSPTNTITDIPKVYYADQVLGDKNNYTRSNNASANLNSENSRFYEKGNYVACREITLSYNFSRKQLSTIKILSQARVYASLNNMFYITKFSGYSPEPPVNSSNQITGIYAGTYPTPRSIVIGAQVSF